MKRSVLLSFTILMLFPLISYGGSPREDFNSDLILAEAASDVTKMPLEEIEVFISYLASCEARAGHVKEFYCDREREVFLIKYERDRAIDRMVTVLNITWMWIEASDKVAKPNSKEKEEIVKTISRYVDITRKLRDSANRRFRSLLTSA